MANTDMSQGSTSLSRICQLQLTVHQELLTDSNITDRTHKEGHGVPVDREITKSILTA